MQPDQPADSLMHRLDSLTDELNELRQEIKLTFQLAQIDPRMTLTRTRRVLEYVVNEVYRRHFNEDPGTRPLENLLTRLIKEHVLPPRVATYASGIREMGNLGTHGRGDEILPSDAQHSLDQLVVILLWYFEQERPDSMLGKAGDAPLRPEADARPVDEGLARNRPTQTTSPEQPPLAQTHAEPAQTVPQSAPQQQPITATPVRRAPNNWLFFVGGAVIAAGVVYAGYSALHGSSGSTPPPAPAPASEATIAPPPASASAVVVTPTPAPAPTPAPQPAPPPQAPLGRPALEGTVGQVLDSGALIVGGQVVNLYAVRGEDGAPAAALQQYVASQGAPLACYAKPGTTYQCYIHGEDIGEHALRNGWARTRKHAPQAYLDAERQARSARLGVWAS